MIAPSSSTSRSIHPAVPFVVALALWVVVMPFGVFLLFTGCHTGPGPDPRDAMEPWFFGGLGLAALETAAAALAGRKRGLVISAIALLLSVPLALLMATLLLRLH